MHDQVGITADGRSKMRVAGGCQSEVAAVIGAVPGLLQRAQHEIAQNALLRLALDLRDQLLIIPRRDGNTVARKDNIAVHHFAVTPAHGRTKSLHGNRADAQRIAEVRGDLFELLHAFGIRFFMDAEDRCDPSLLQVRSDGFVGRKHELLNDAVRDIAGAARDTGHFSKLVELDQRFRHVEIDGAASNTFLVQDQRQLTHQLEPVD